MIALLQPMIHGDIVQGAIDNSLWFRVVVAGFCVFNVLFSTYVWRNMVTKGDLKTALLELKGSIEQDVDKRFLRKDLAASELRRGVAESELARLREHPAGD